MKVTSDQIDHHPAIRVEEGGNVSIQCAKTHGTTSEWKFLIEQSNRDPLELLYSMNLTILKELDVIAITEEGRINKATGMQNFSILLINVTMRMTGIALECGARRNEGAREVLKFHNNAAVLIVHKGGQ